MFSEAINLDPTFIGAYRSRGEAYQGIGKEDEAGAETRAIERQAPKGWLNSASRGY